MFDINIVEFFSGYAYQPMMVYSFIVLFMTASSFGLPIPEELTLVSAGLVAYMARNPDQFPPPTPDAEGVNLLTLSIVCFVAVLGSDILIYFLGRIFGSRIIGSDFFKKRFPPAHFKKIQNLFDKYGHYASGVFRFTPGVRFPGHLSCGTMNIPLIKFIVVDGSAALISVPTQVLLVAFYGEVILEKFTEFKLILASILGIIILYFVLRKIIKKFRKSKPLQ